MSDEQNVDNRELSKKELKEQAKIEKQQAKERAKLEKQKKDKKQKKERKPGLFKRLRDSWGELKKTTWATFGTVVRKTGVVLLVVLIFTAVLFGIDYGLGALYRLLVG